MHSFGRALKWASKLAPIIVHARNRAANVEHHNTPTPTHTLLHSFFFFFLFPIDWGSAKLSNETHKEREKKEEGEGGKNMVWQNLDYTRSMLGVRLAAVECVGVCPLPNGSRPLPNGVCKSWHCCQPDHGEWCTHYSLVAHKRAHTFTHLDPGVSSTSKWLWGTSLMKTTLRPGTPQVRLATHFLYT